jgi:hypothetical protein
MSGADPLQALATVCFSAINSKTLPKNEHWPRRTAEGSPACGMSGFPNLFNYGSLWECFAFMLLLSLGPARL